MRTFSGRVYEQFLGRVISLTLGRRVKVEEKPEVKKAGAPTTLLRTSFSSFSNTRWEMHLQDAIPSA